MQPSAGQDLPHTRTRGVHWISTAAALGAVVAAVALVQPADASQDKPAATATTPAAPVAPPDPAAVTYPLACGDGVKTDVISKVSGDLDGDGRPETAVVVRCHTDTGTPPSGVYVLSAPAKAGGPPRIAVTLVKPEDNRQISHFRLEGRTLMATVLGFSSDAVPQCCPDLSRGYSWEWRDGRYVALPGPAGTSV
ncbi:hypothetical protein NMG29_21890 [Streptomyces cocklensis]|uniref:Secreted protein n=1 Tax=Actinacidiphila cocklensis TaxID=887465 RepID=A0A9W4GTR3_9ACTN|nr:hypothetical protein [Actinacidiphila cocklensis]MDD1060831.1 hypothetical protein [Actinacidiphila cocklensis]WSX73653.1 hypothetical protein OH826_07175 [Streptomyces sp. NBC_00899]WSX80284.1 hypothetical protein OH826_44335 [Streptomyces sp. NBC_00899]CAG6396789.1 conserved exported hypothetical protein [Actinacidiphila cocklensis]